MLNQYKRLSTYSRQSDQSFVDGTGLAYDNTDMWYDQTEWCAVSVLKIRNTN